MSATPPNHHLTHGSYLMPSLEHATVADAMHPGIMTCDPGATATDVARMMASHHVHCIAVAAISHDHPGESLVWSIVSDIDLIRAGVVGDPDMTASKMASAPAVAVELSTPLLEAARLMLKHSSSHLLVVDPGAQRPVGMISTLDIAGILAWGEA
jgi:CBS domain-containing protein